MSGLTLAAGPRAKPPPLMPDYKPPAPVGGLVGSVSFLQVQMISYISVFTISGLVPYSELLFALFVFVYIVVLSAFVFPNTYGKKPPAVFAGRRYFQLYVVGGTALGLFLPLGYVFGSFTRGDQVGVQAATPHLFLLSCQILAESIIGEMSSVSLPVRALVPCLFTARRIISISSWLREVNRPENALGVWTDFGRLLAIANAVFWSFNLFVFLVPIFLPLAFKKHFELQHSNQTVAPAADSPRSSVPSPRRHDASTAAPFSPRQMGAEARSYREKPADQILSELDKKS
eukprot:jgi/Mesen1/9562/ME000640S08898